MKLLAKFNLILGLVLGAGLAVAALLSQKYLKDAAREEVVTQARLMMGAMRAARDSGPDGLAGMAALVEHREARLLRPLLAVPRARLTATLQARGIGWIDDPSNEDRRFERVRTVVETSVALSKREQQNLPPGPETATLMGRAMAILSQPY